MSAARDPIAPTATPIAVPTRQPHSDRRRPGRLAAVASTIEIRALQELASRR